MQTIIQKLSFSVILKVLSLAILAVTTIQAMHEPSFMAGLTDSKLYVEVLTALIAANAKSNKEHGTSDVPLNVNASKAVNASVAPIVSFVGDPVGDSAVLFHARDGDPTPVGKPVVDSRGTFIKREANVYEKTG